MKRPLPCRWSSPDRRSRADRRRRREPGGRGALRSRDGFTFSRRAPWTAATCLPRCGLGGSGDLRRDGIPGSGRLLAAARARDRPVEIHRRPGAARAVRPGDGSRGTAGTPRQRTVPPWMRWPWDAWASWRPAQRLPRPRRRRQTRQSGCGRSATSRPHLLWRHPAHDPRPGGWWASGRSSRMRWASMAGRPPRAGRRRARTTGRGITPTHPCFKAAMRVPWTEAGRSRDAVAAYRRALARWPENTALLQGYATAARDAGLADDAMKAEQAVLALDPTDAAAENGIGLLHADASRPAEARDAFRRALALDPNVVSYWVNLGNACRAGGQMPDAEAAYRRALALDSASPDAMNGIGVLLVQQDRAADAIDWLERAVEPPPPSTRRGSTWVSRGRSAVTRPRPPMPIAGSCRPRRVTGASARRHANCLPASPGDARRPRTWRGRPASRSLRL